MKIINSPPPQKIYQSSTNVLFAEEKERNKINLIKTQNLLLKKVNKYTYLDLDQNVLLECFPSMYQ